MKLSVASVTMTNTGYRCGEKCVCNEQPGSKCEYKQKPKKFNLVGFLSIDDTTS